MSARDCLRNAIYQMLYCISGPGRGLRLILLYHSIGGGTPLSVPAATFVEEMRILTEHFTVVPLRALLPATASAGREDNIACVTFDDGYQDNYEHALPVLERLGIKGTFFITTGFLGRLFPTYAGQYPLMRPEEVRELVSLGHEVGAHTENHCKLTTVSPAAARNEIQRSKQFLEDLVGREVGSFAYPKGDYNESVKAHVASLGFACAVTTRPGIVGVAPDWLTLPRIWISDRLSLPVFEAKISPVTGWFARLRPSAS